MDVNKPEPSAGITGVMRAIAAIAVILVAGVGILAVLGVIPQEALQEWATKDALVALIVASDSVLLYFLSRSGR